MTSGAPRRRGALRDEALHSGRGVHAPIDPKAGEASESTQAYIDRVELQVKRANLHARLFVPASIEQVRALAELTRQGRVAWIESGPTWLGGWHWTPARSSACTPDELTQGSRSETV